MRTLAELKAAIVAKEVALAEKKAEHADLAARANSAGDEEQALQTEVTALWAEMQDATRESMLANPDASTYQEVGAAMDERAAAASDQPPPEGQ